MKKLVYLLVISLSLGVMSCGKDGSIGPEGPRGERGEAGTAGKDGIDGTTILNGSNDPTAQEGSVGDFYLNTNSYVLFGPKNKDGWGKGESILGATGAKGAKGDKGDKGDKGEKGNTGPKGDKGEKGDTGARGAKGDKGDKGEADYVILSGTIDPNNSIGKTGDFYLNRSSKTFFYRSNRIIDPINDSYWQKVANLANTIQFTKTGFDLKAYGSPSSVSLEIDLPWEIFEKSMAAVYLQREGRGPWLPMPGSIRIVNSVTFIDLSFSKTSNDKTGVWFRREAGGIHHLNNKVRIIVTEADVFKTVSRSIDFRNYHEVSQYFNLSD